MKRIALALIIVCILAMFMVSGQQDITIKQFNQDYKLLPNGNLQAVWDLTIVPEGYASNMILHAFFSKKAYINTLVVSDAEGSLNSRILSREGVPLIEITFRDRLSPGTEYYFTCELEVWKAVEIGEAEGSFSTLTGYNFPIEELDITVEIPEGAELRNYFPADGKVSSGKSTTVSWSMDSLPAGYNIQISVAFDVLSEAFADGLFEDGVDFYRLQDFEKAKEKFDHAQQVYEKLNLNDKVNECILYKQRIEGMETGLPLFQEAVDLYKREEYAQAQNIFEQVKTVYEEHNIPTDEVDSYISQSTTYVKAYDELEKAESFLEQEDTEKAKTHFLKAKDFFSQVNNQTMVDHIDAKIEQIQPVPTEEPKKPDEGRGGGGVLILVILVVVVIGGVAYFVMKQKKPAPVYSEDDIREEMRQLKARFVYGEINKKEYEDLLAELEKKGKKE
ncbi:MAG: tetratricopeptide repeat protein [Candidatus Methanofastidiosia archaeon]|jgi:tetratricopeptide (TPR) repeat protein